MTRTIYRLTGADLNRKRPGMYADGGGLWLQITTSKDGEGRNRSWIFRYATGERSRSMGLGSLNTIGLAEARERARRCRELRLDGVDPIEARDAARAARAAQNAKAITFDEAADRYVKAHRAGWRAKHAAQWSATLSKYVSPVFGKLPVDRVDTGLVIRALEPIWSEVPETANRLRGRIECVLDWARARDLRKGENPARWRGHLEELLPPLRKIRRVEHHPAMPYRDVPAFVADLGKRSGTAERALEFLILTAGRSGEILGARWREVDLVEKVWIVPPGRMKGNRPHRVPLTARGVAILEEMGGAARPRGDLVFPGRTGEAAMWGETFTRLMKRLGRGDVTPHGFRSSFRDWSADRTNYPNHVVEMALAHAVGNAVEAAYRRGDLFEKRRRLMAEWDRYLARPASTGATVTPLRGGGARA
jgi:integrase